VCLDALSDPLGYGDVDAAGEETGAGNRCVVAEFMVDWEDDTAKWVDAVLKRASVESGSNRILIAEWHERWIERARLALAPLATKVLGSKGDDALRNICISQKKRIERIGAARSTEVAS